MAILAIAGYPLALIVGLVLAPKLDVIPGLGAVLGLAILAVTMFAMYQLYRFRSQMIGSTNANARSATGPTSTAIAGSC